MFDTKIRRIINPGLDMIASKSGLEKLPANTITIFGFCAGVLSCLMVSVDWMPAALVLLVVNRACDGLDGTVARLQGETRFGGYLDIVLDFIFYSGYVFAFAVRDAEVALWASFLIFSFAGTGTTFLAFAIFEQKYGKAGQSKDYYGKKAFKYIGGLSEGTETIAVFVALTLWPAYFPWLAGIFGLICWVTVVQRIIEAKMFLVASDDPES